MSVLCPSYTSSPSLLTSSQSPSYTTCSLHSTKDSQVKSRLFSRSHLPGNSASPQYVTARIWVMRLCRPSPLSVITYIICYHPQLHVMQYDGPAAPRKVTALFFFWPGVGLRDYISCLTYKDDSELIGFGPVGCCGRTLGSYWTSFCATRGAWRVWVRWL